MHPSLWALHGDAWVILKVGMSHWKRNESVYKYVNQQTIVTANEGTLELANGRKMSVCAFKARADSHFGL